MCQTIENLQTECGYRNRPPSPAQLLVSPLSHYPISCTCCGQLEKQLQLYSSVSSFIYSCGLLLSLYLYLLFHLYLYLYLQLWLCICHVGAGVVSASGMCRMCQNVCSSKSEHREQFSLLFLFPTVVVVVVVQDEVGRGSGAAATFRERALL